MTVEVRNGEWVLCRGQAVYVSEEEIQRMSTKATNRKFPRSRAKIVANIALGKRIGTFREWPRTKEEGD